MYAPERQQTIVERARSNGRVDVTALATTLAVTTETIRRDLDVLERHGVLRRVHGGAIPVDKLTLDPGEHARHAVMATEKERIAKAALDHVPEEGAVLFDAGTTTARLAELLPSEYRLTVVTNAVPLVSTLANQPRTTVLLLGGKVHGQAMATVDEWAVHELANTHVGVAFLGADGISPARGLTATDTRQATVKRAMIRAAGTVVALADHSKIGNDQLARFGGLDQLDSIITDSGVDTGLAQRLAAAGPTVIRA